MKTTLESLHLNPQIVREIYEEAKRYEDVVDLTLGDPDIPTPHFIIEDTIRALNNNQTKYTANSGLPELREQIRLDVRKRTGVSYDSASEITVTAGAMGALFLTSVAILEPGDEMIVLEPNWPNYLNMVRMCRAKDVCVSLFSDDIIRDIRNNLSSKTKAIILNSPSNPTGRILDWEILCQIADIAKEYNLYVISDEVYHTIVFHGEYRSIVEIDGMKERTILVDSLSKRFSMTGYRVGFLCAPKEIAALTAQLQENVNSCACMFAQVAATVALRDGANAEKELTQIFYQRCSAMADVLRMSPHLRLPRPDATFYLFAHIRKTGLSSVEFVKKLLHQKHIAVVPGNAFGASGEGYIRIACTLSRESLVEVAREIVAFVGENTKSNTTDM